MLISIGVMCIHPCPNVPNTIESTYTIQGLDLNYAGVVIGPSVKYRDGQIIFDEKSSANKKATRKRTLEDGSKQYFSNMLLKNELNVLLTRGVNGLYIYAVDDQLREALKNASKGDKYE
ncbi:DNA/RNA helicase domain-containing protein [Staphylococcus sp. 11007852]